MNSGCWTSWSVLPKQLTKLSFRPAFSFLMFPSVSSFLRSFFRGSFWVGRVRQRLKMMRCFPSQPGKAVMCRGAPGYGERRHSYPPGGHVQCIAFTFRTPFSLVPLSSPAGLRVLCNCQSSSKAKM